MLQFEEADRINISGIREHPWFNLPLPEHLDKTLTVRAEASACVPPLPSRPSHTWADVPVQAYGHACQHQSCLATRLAHNCKTGKHAPLGQPHTTRTSRCIHSRCA